MVIKMDNALLTTIISSLISASAGAAVSAIVTKARTLTEAASSKDAAITEAVKTNLMATLYDLHHRFVDQEEDLDAMGLQLAATTYSVYHDELHGNGLGTKLFEEIAAKNVRK